MKKRGIKIAIFDQSQKQVGKLQNGWLGGLVVPPLHFGGGDWILFVPQVILCIVTGWPQVCDMAEYGAVSQMRRKASRETYLTNKQSS